MEPPALMKYGKIVRDLAARVGDWRFYDTQFWLLRHTNLADQPWGNMHWELWIRAQNFDHSRSPKTQPPMRTHASNSSASVSVLFVPKD